MGSSYTEAMRITSSGNIGVGVAIQQKLMVKGIIASEATNPPTIGWHTPGLIILLE